MLLNSKLHTDGRKVTVNMMKFTVQVHFMSTSTCQVVCIVTSRKPCKTKYYCTHVITLCANEICYTTPIKDLL